MPDLLDRSLEDMLAAMAAQFGVRWPNPWWPTGNAAYDDCAAAVSFYLFGLNSSGNPRYSYVSQLQNYFDGLGRRSWGHAGIQRGDVLAFSWTKDPNSFDHTEIALGPVSPAGLITSRGTNSNPGDDMADRTRSASYVVSYSRPAYPGTTSASLGGKKITDPAAAEEEGEGMKIISVPNGTVAQVGELFGMKYTSPSGGQGFSIGVNSKIYGTVSGLTEDEVTTAVNEATARRVQLISEVTASVVRSIPAAQVVSGSVTVDVAKIAAAVDAALADNFAALPGAIASEAAARLAK